MYLGSVVREFEAVPRLLPVDDDLTGSGSEVVGWRVWVVGRNRDELEGSQWFLKSLVLRYEWSTPGVRNAVPPEPGLLRLRSGAGFHLFKNRPQADALARHWRRWQPTVVGSCALVGRVVEHKLGYRAQGVVVRILTVDPSRFRSGVVDSVVCSLRDRYQCEVDLSPHPSRVHDAAVLERTETDANHLWGTTFGSGAVGTVDFDGSEL